MKTIDGQRRTRAMEKHARLLVQLCEAWLNEKSVPDVCLCDFLGFRIREIRKDLAEKKIG